MVFAKNEALLGLLGNTLPYNQLIIYILTTLCAIFMPLASKLLRSQWFEVGQSAKEKSIFGQIRILDHERSPVQLSVSITLPYNQLIIYIITTLCAISMPLASKLWRSQWFEVGQSAIAKSIFGQIWLLDHEKNLYSFQSAMQSCSASKIS